MEEGEINILYLTAQLAYDLFIDPFEGFSWISESLTIFRNLQQYFVGAGLENMSEQ